MTPRHHSGDHITVSPFIPSAPVAAFSRFTICRRRHRPGSAKAHLALEPPPPARRRIWVIVTCGQGGRGRTLFAPVPASCRRRRSPVAARRAWQSFSAISVKPCRRKRYRGGASRYHNRARFRRRCPASPAVTGIARLRVAAAVAACVVQQSVAVDGVRDRTTQASSRNALEIIVCPVPSAW